MDSKNRNLQIYTAEIDTRQPLVYAEAGIRAGFPSPAQDYISSTIDLNQELIRHPASTFYGRVEGDSMLDEGIEDDDILIIDRSLEPVNNDLAVCCIDGEFTLKRIRIESDHVWLIPSNSAYSPILVTEENEFAIWGIVTYTIKKNRRRRNSQ